MKARLKRHRLIIYFSTTKYIKQLLPIVYYIIDNMINFGAFVSLIFFLLRQRKLIDVIGSFRIQLQKNLYDDFCRRNFTSPKDEANFLQKLWMQICSNCVLITSLTDHVILLIQNHSPVIFFEILGMPSNCLEKFFC